MGVVEAIALSMGAAWASGINLYAALATLGVLGATGYIVLPPELAILANPVVIAAAGFMYTIEFVADKIPGVDTAWDSLHTFIRIPAGAVLAAGAVGDIGTGAQVAAAIVGGSLAAATHCTKAGSRVLINASPEPFSNWGASIAEDIAVIVGMWAAVKQPEIFLVLLILFIALMIYLLPKIWRGIRKVFAWLIRLFGGKTEEDGGEATAPASPAPDPEPPEPSKPPDTGT